VNGIVNKQPEDINPQITQITRIPKTVNSNQQTANSEQPEIILSESMNRYSSPSLWEGERGEGLSEPSGPLPYPLPMGEGVIVNGKVNSRQQTARIIQITQITRIPKTVKTVNSKRQTANSQKLS
jgi:hypothetical protein